VGRLAFTALEVLDSGFRREPGCNTAGENAGAIVK
jgi:hypothetical protein